jgi:uncharacterized protein (TIGR03437 family)
MVGSQFNAGRMPDAAHTSGGNNRVRVLIPATDSSGTPQLILESAATYEVGPLAAESIGTIYGTGLAASTQTAGAAPASALAGVTVTVRDAAGVDRQAPLFYVSPGQINFAMPAGTAAGAGFVGVKTAAGATLISPIQIARVWPGVFTLNGQGLAAAYVTRVRPDNSQTVEPIYRVEDGAVVAAPIDLGPATDRVYLVLFGTGIRAAGSVSVAIGGWNAEVSYAGPQGTCLGEDQVNILLPRELAGAGVVPLALTADGYAASILNISVL